MQVEYFYLIVLLLVISLILSCLNITYEGFTSLEEDTEKDTEEIVATTEITNGSVTNVLPSHTKSLLKSIKIVGKCTQSARIMPLISDDIIVGYLIVDGGFGYEEAPKILINKTKNATKAKKIKTSDLSLLIKGQNKIIDLLSKFQNTQNTQNDELNPTTIQKYSDEYDKITKSVNDAHATQRASLEKTLQDIQADKKNASDLYEKAKKLGIKDKPPLKYSSNYEKQINDNLETIKNIKPMTPSQKAKCYLLYNDMTTKSDKAEDLGQRSESNANLRTSAERYGQLAQNAISLYNSTCLS